MLVSCLTLIGVDMKGRSCNCMFLTLLAMNKVSMGVGYVFANLLCRC